MREIESRGKRIDNSEWIYGCYCKGFEEFITEVVNIRLKGKEFYSAIQMVFYNEYGCIEYISNPIAIDENTLGQYTGLKDKNGTKIFEGDIIKNNYGSIYVVNYFIDWSSFSLKLVFLKSESKLIRANGRQHLYENDCNRLEVIGNIYDNKLEDFYE